MSKLNHFEPKWKALYTIAGYLAFLNIILIFVQVIIFSIWMPPAINEAKKWLELFSSNPLLGFINLDLLLLLNNIILIPIYLVLYFTLKKENESWMLIGLVLALMGLAAYIPSNPAFEIFFLSRTYMEVDIAEKTSLIIAAQALLMHWHGTTFVVYYFLNAAILLIYGRYMLKSSSYRKVTAWVCLASGILMCVPSNFGIIGLVFSLLSLLPWIVFTMILGFRFIREGRQE